MRKQHKLSLIHGCSVGAMAFVPKMVTGDYSLAERGYFAVLFSLPTVQIYLTIFIAKAVASHWPYRNTWSHHANILFLIRFYDFWNERWPVSKNLLREHSFHLLVPDVLFQAIDGPFWTPMNRLSYTSICIRHHQSGCSACESYFRYFEQEVKNISSLSWRQVTDVKDISFKRARHLLLNCVYNGWNGLGTLIWLIDLGPSRPKFEVILDTPSGEKLNKPRAA